MADENALPEDGLTDEQMDQLASSQGPSPANQAVPDDGLTDEQMDQLQAGATPPSSSAIGAAARSFARGILPNTAAALAGNVAGVGAGVAALPETGPAAPFIGGAAAAAVAGGVGYVATRAQNELLKKLGLDLEPQEQADVTQHPYASEVGNWASLLATFNLGSIETKLAQRAITGSIMGGLDLTQQAMNKGVSNIDPTEAAVATAGGALLGGVRPWAAGSERIGTQLGEAIRRNPIHSTVSQGGVAGRPNQPQAPDAVELRQESETPNDLTLVSRGVAQENIAPTHQPDTVQPEKAPSATIDVVRSDTAYGKGRVPVEEGVPGAPTTEGITFDDQPAADIQAALGMQAAPARAEPQPPIETGLAALNPARQMLWQRRLPPRPAAAQGQMGEAFQPEPAPAQLPGGNTRDVQIIRHGATDLNHNDLSVDRLRGWTNVPLSDAGVQEAHKTSEDVAKSPPGHIITSDLDRAHETARIISQNTGAPIVGVTPNLRPWNVGELAGKKSKEGVPILADYAENHPNTPVPGGESFNQFRARFFTGLDNILDHSPNKPAIVIHHRGERLLKAWADAGYPADGSIDISTFNQKGEPTGKAEDLQIPPDRVKAAAQSLRDQAQQPAAPATAPAEPLRVAAISGGKTYVGEPGQLHADLWDKYPIKNNAQLGFVDAQGNYLDRKSALEWVNKNQPGVKVRPEPGNEGYLHGVDYDEALRAAPRTPKVEPTAKEPPEGQPAVQTTPREQQILDSLKNLEGGEEAAQALAKTTGDQRTAAFEKAAQAVKNAPEKREKVGEVQTGGGARGARKTAASNAVKSAYDAFPPGAEEDDQALLDRLQKAVDHAKEQYGGKNPVDRKEGYAPRIKPAEWQFIKKAQDLLKNENPSDRQLEQFRTDEGLLRSGGAADVQSTKRITADIEKRQQPTSEVAEAAGAAGTTELPARQDFDLMEPWKPGADESKQYIESSNELRTWINNLDDADYRAVEAAYPNVKEIVETAGYPHRLQLQMESDLEGAQQKRAAPTPVAEPRPTAGAAPAVTEPGAAASQGVSRKDLIAEYNAKLKAGQLPGGNKLSPEERLAAEREAQTRGTPTERAPVAPEEPGIKEEDHAYNPVTGDDDGESAESTLQKFLADKSGAVNLGSIQGSMKDFKTWLAGGTSATPSEHFMAAASKSPLETAARDTAEALHVKTQRLNEWKNKLLQEAQKIPDTFTAKDHMDMFRAMEQGKVATLNPQQQAFVRDVLGPLRYYNQVMYEGLRKFAPEKYPELQINHMPRRIIGQSEFDEPSGVSADPIEGVKRVLSTEPPSLKDRNYMALEDANGKRFVVEPDAAGKIKVWQGGKYKIYKAPSYEPTVGKQIDVAGKQYTIQDAHAQEITRNALRDGKPVQYHENAFAVLANESARLFDALQNVQFLEKMKSDPRFVYDPKTGLGGATTDAKIAEEMKWQKSRLPQFKEWFMAPPYRQVFDDYAQPGLFHGASTDWIKSLGQAALKTMFWLPTAHLDNVFQHWIVARGSKWFTVQGMRNLGQTLPQAIKSVMAQDAIQSQMRGIGEDRAAGTVYGGVVTQDFTQRIAEASMLDMYRNPSAWDPIIRPLGIPLPEFAKAVYRVSKHIMWSGNDMMLTQLYLENKLNGMGHDKAIVEAERHFPNYRLPTTVMGSRILQEAMAEPIITAFGRYRYGMMNSYANIAKDLVNGGTAERTEAMAKIALLGIMGFVAYPLLNKMAQYVTGNKQAYMQPRGPMTIPVHVQRVLQGKEDLGSLLGTLASTPPLINTLNEIRTNTNWQGKKIVPPSTTAEMGPGKTWTQRLKGAGLAAVQEAEHAATGLIQPLETAQEIYRNPRSAVGNLAGRFADIKNPTPGASKYLNQLPAKLQAERKARFKKPLGMAEDTYNRLIGNQ